jgi:hypothetical protein
MSTSSPANTRTLRLHGLRNIDEAAVRIFLKLAHQQTRSVWELSDAPEVDLLLVAAAQAQEVQAIMQTAKVVSWVVAREQQAPADGRHTLSRPLQLEAFYDLLRQCEPCASPSAAAAAGAKAMPAPTQAPAPQLAQNTKYRLKRWPTAQCLGDSKHDARLASFLSARFLNLAELVQLSHVEADVCAAFVSRMQAQALLELRQEAPATVVADMQVTTLLAGAASTASSHPTRSTQPGPQASVRLVERPTHLPLPARTAGTALSTLPGLIGRLRERLGMKQRPSTARVSLAR